MSTPDPSFQGSLLIVVAPSGAGKTSLVRDLLTKRDNLALSVSYTTRAPRLGERDGVDYYFIDPREFFSRRDQGDFLEWAEVHGNYYATSRTWIEAQMSTGKDIVLEIDWQGAEQVCQIMPCSVTVFIAPPSIAILRQRLTERAQDEPDVIERRLAGAVEELQHAVGCRYVIINESFSVACQELAAILDASRCRFSNQASRHADLFSNLGMIQR